MPKKFRKKFKFVRNLVRHYNRQHPDNQLILQCIFDSAVWITNSRRDLSRVLYLDWSKASLKTLFSTIRSKYERIS